MWLSRGWKNLGAARVRSFTYNSLRCTYRNQLSAIYDGPPLSPERKTFCMLPLISFCILIFLQKCYSQNPPLVEANVLASAQPCLLMLRHSLMSLGSYSPENDNTILTDLWIFWFTPTANKVCGLYPFSPERETCCILPVNQLSHTYLFTKWKKCNILSLFHQKYYVKHKKNDFPTYGKSFFVSLVFSCKAGCFA